MFNTFVNALFNQSTLTMIALIYSHLFAHDKRVFHSNIPNHTRLRCSNRDTYSDQWMTSYRFDETRKKLCDSKNVDTCENKFIYKLQVGLFGVSFCNEKWIYHLVNFAHHFVCAINRRDSIKRINATVFRMYHMALCELPFEETTTVLIRVENNHTHTSTIPPSTTGIAMIWWWWCPTDSILSVFTASPWPVQ